MKLVYVCVICMEYNCPLAPFHINGWWEYVNKTALNKHETNYVDKKLKSSFMHLFEINIKFKISDPKKLKTHEKYIVNRNKKLSCMLLFMTYVKFDFRFRISRPKNLKNDYPHEISDI